jgi:hypothetical protein
MFVRPVVFLLLSGYEQISIDLPRQLSDLVSSAKGQFPSIGDSPISFTATWKGEKVGRCTLHFSTYLFVKA